MGTCILKKNFSFFFFNQKSFYLNLKNGNVLCYVSGCVVKKKKNYFSHQIIKTFSLKREPNLVNFLYKVHCCEKPVFPFSHLDVFRIMRHFIGKPLYKHFKFSLLGSFISFRTLPPYPRIFHVYSYLF